MIHIDDVYSFIFVSNYILILCNAVVFLAIILCFTLIKLEKKHVDRWRFLIRYILTITEYNHNFVQ